MNRHRSAAGVLGLLITALTMCALPAAAEEEDGWASLYDGASLKGWKRVNGSASYVSVNGAIVGTTRMDSPNSFLATEKT